MYDLTHTLKTNNHSEFWAVEFNNTVQYYSEIVSSQHSIRKALLNTCRHSSLFQEYNDILKVHTELGYSPNKTAQVITTTKRAPSSFVEPRSLQKLIDIQVGKITTFSYRATSCQVSIPLDFARKEEQFRTLNCEGTVSICDERKRVSFRWKVIPVQSPSYLLPLKRQSLWTSQFDTALQMTFNSWQIQQQIA